MGGREEEGEEARGWERKGEDEGNERNGRNEGDGRNESNEGNEGNEREREGRRVRMAGHLRSPWSRRETAGLVGMGAAGGERWKVVGLWCAEWGWRLLGEGWVCVRARRVVVERYAVR